MAKPTAHNSDDAGSIAAAVARNEELQTACFWRAKTQKALWHIAKSSNSKCVAAAQKSCWFAGEIGEGLVLCRSPVCSGRKIPFAATRYLKRLKVRFPELRESGRPKPTGRLSGGSRPCSKTFPRPITSPWAGSRVPRPTVPRPSAPQTNAKYGRAFICLGLVFATKARHKLQQGYLRG